MLNRLCCFIESSHYHIATNSVLVNSLVRTNVIINRNMILVGMYMRASIFAKTRRNSGRSSAYIVTTLGSKLDNFFFINHWIDKLKMTSLGVELEKTYCPFPVKKCGSRTRVIN